MISVSVSLSVSCTVHVSGTGSDVCPIQSTTSLAVGGIVATDTNKTTQQLSVLRNFPASFKELFLLPSALR